MAGKTGGACRHQPSFLFYVHAAGYYNRLSFPGAPPSLEIVNIQPLSLSDLANLIRNAPKRFRVNISASCYGVNINHTGNSPR